jgi:hypothetical protein
MGMTELPRESGRAENPVFFYLERRFTASNRHRLRRRAKLQKLHEEKSMALGDLQCTPSAAGGGTKMRATGSAAGFGFRPRSSTGSSYA